MNGLHRALWSSGRTVATLVVVSLIVAACGSGGGSSTATAPKNLPAAPQRENIAFLYENIRSRHDVTKLGKVQLVVTAQGNGAEAARLIHSTGAKAYRYVQTYWFPAGRAYDGLDIADHQSWEFCKSGSQPLVGRTDARGTKWWYLDMNEQAVHDYFATKLQQLKAEGWDGVFFDRGYASLTGIDEENAGIWNTSSTCTEHPVEPGATFADAYVGMSREVAQAGLKLIMNYGVSPFDVNTPLRPDPRDRACGERDWAQCKRLDDAWQNVTWFLDEAAAHPMDQQWAQDFKANQANEQDPQHGGKTLALLTSGTLGGNQTRDDVYYEWARVKLFAIPIGVNTGDSGCAGVTAACNRASIYPELADVGFGRPIRTAPLSTECVSGSSTQCVWSRPYAYGMSVVNASPRPVQNAELTLGVDGCRYVKDVWSGRPLAQGKCVTKVDVDLPAWSGRPLIYGVKPW